MTSFMRWLYVYYIQPQLKIAAKKEYKESLSRLENAMTTERMELDFEKVQEFTAVEAFLLGYHTGLGLPEAHRQWING